MQAVNHDQSLPAYPFATPATPRHTGDFACLVSCLERVVKLLLRSFLACSGLILLPSVAHAEQVVCHYTYGGKTKQLVAMPVASPYAVKDIAVGSYFRFRAVFQQKPADIASVKVYTYADRDEGPVLIHQATYPYPPVNAHSARYGFSGLQFVYEPMRDGELQYWCALDKSTRGITR